MKQNYLNEKIELFVELVHRKIPVQAQAIKWLQCKGRHEEAEFLTNLSDVNWTLGFFEGTIVRDDFPMPLDLAS